MAKIEKIVVSYSKGMFTDVYTVKYASGTVRSYKTHTVNGMIEKHIMFIMRANVISPIYDNVTGEHIKDIYECWE